MVDPIDNIAKQARQGSVAAIIQVLNEKLADSGVRTRAVFEKGVLQLLCEAATCEQLEQSLLVDRVQRILESICPRSIRRVNINSRIVREQQLLWLEEIMRDPDELLWSQEITLAQPNLFKRLWEDWNDKDKHRITQSHLSRATNNRKKNDRSQFWRGIIGGASLSLLLLLLGWVLNDWLDLNLGEQVQTALSEDDQKTVEAVDSATPNTPVPPLSGGDPFVQAVRLAERAASDGQAAQSSADWLDLASRWQRAADLMKQVEAGDPRYATAQNRIELYQQFSLTALQKAEQQSAQ